MIRYFSYGSNMSPQRLRDRGIDAKKIGVFRLDKYDLRFHKVSKDGSAKCDAYFTGCDDDFVLGVLYEVSEDEKKTLDRFEGLGRGYEEKVVTVCMKEHAQEAITYVATNFRDNLLPYAWYKRHVLEGAKAAGFPDTYIDRLKNVASQDDEDSEREMQELLIYK